MTENRSFERTGPYQNDCPYCKTHNAILWSCSRPELHYCRDCKRWFRLLEPRTHWLEVDGYVSVRIPYSDNPTAWHPTVAEGEFSVLTRGAFESEYEAEAWVRQNIPGHAYTLIWF